MKTIKMTVGGQLVAGFTVILSLIVVFGISSYFQTKEMANAAETILQHPLAVLEATNTIEIWTLKERVALRDLLLSNNQEEKHDALADIDLARAGTSLEFTTLYELYLGEIEDVDDLYFSYQALNTEVDSIIELVDLGELEAARLSILPDGTVGLAMEDLMIKQRVIHEFATAKAASLTAAALALSDSLMLQTVLLLIGTTVLSFLIAFMLIKRIRTPIHILMDATLGFQKGNLDSRSSYDQHNEFGELSTNFNNMATTVKTMVKMNEKISNFLKSTLYIRESNHFYQLVLSNLTQTTGAQMGAMYLLSEDKKRFEFKESIGLEVEAKQCFSVNDLAGEFGSVISTKTIQLIKDIPDTTRFAFATVGGTFLPKEMMTIPIVANYEVIAIISLSTIFSFASDATQLIESTVDALSARIEGVIAFEKIKNFSQQLENQKRELDAQKNEMTSLMSELAQQNSELEVQKQKLNEASKLKTNFLSTMSHELRTPLNSVIALSSILSRKLAHLIPEEEHSYLEVIERNGKNLLLLINDILDISRIEAGREEIEVTSFHPDELVAELVGMIEPQAKQKNLEIIFQSGTSKLMMTSDREKLRHIIQNIVSNAVKFTDTGSVEIISRHHGNQVEWLIKDTGIGIAKEFLPVLFNEFRQVDSTISRKYGGSGLGLAIAKKYAVMLGGTITVDSTLGKGSIFTVTLPLVSSTLIKKDENETKDFPHVSKHKLLMPGLLPGVKTLLLVDDSEPAVLQIKDLLEASGYNILVASNAFEAYKIIENVVPDAILLDLMLPDIDGFAVLKTLREAEPTANVPVLVLTGKTITKDELRFLKRNNVHQLLQKGDINRVELQNAVTLLLYPALSKPKRKQTNYLPSDTLKILIVEDNADNMITVKALLSPKFQIIEATNGQMAIEVAQATVPNLILMDIALPVLNGIEAFSAIRKIPKLQHIPVIALTASAMTEDREAVLAHGFDAFIAKPIIEPLFFRIINEVLYGK